MRFFDDLHDALPAARSKAASAKHRLALREIASQGRSRSAANDEHHSQLDGNAVTAKKHASWSALCNLLPDLSLVRAEPVWRSTD